MMYYKGNRPRTFQYNERPMYSLKTNDIEGIIINV